MPHLLHIGMPICYSRPIQDMFARDQGNFYLGMEPKDGVPRQVLYAVETELLQVPNHHYNEDIVRQLFTVALETARESSGGAVILSDDRIVEAYRNSGVSLDERLARLSRAMPEDTTVLMVVRNPVDYLKAYYRYLVVERALPLGFEDYVKYLLVRGSKSFLGLLDAAAIYRTAKSHFGNVVVLLHEQLRERPDSLHEALAAHGVEVSQPLLTNDPQAYADAHVACCRMLATERMNSAAGHPDLMLDGGDLDTLAANSPLFETLLLRHALEEAARENIKEGALKLAMKRPDAKIDYSLDHQTQEMLDGYVVQVNRTLAALTGLPLDAYGYDMDLPKAAGVAAE